MLSNHNWETSPEQRQAGLATQHVMRRGRARAHACVAAWWVGGRRTRLSEQEVGIDWRHADAEALLVAVA